MELRFDGQVALITGSSTGIGAALARAFGAAGASVVVHYGSSADAARSVAHDIEAAGGAALVAQADITNTTQLEAMRDATLERFGRIDILINNAGSMVKRVPIADSSDEIAREVFDINFISTVAMSRLVVPAMRSQGRGNIINVTSVAARHGGGGGAVLYAASKGAVSTFTRGLAKELAPSNIRVNALAPGVIVTPFHDRFTNQQQMDAMVATIPMGRAGTPEECVGAVFFLAADALSGYITGQIIEVNGGQYMP
ncbi:MAG TPA: glucose 1-dehydrogenase [Roseiflexaceae bacterium]|nr:glucose 1-dehydrogenase [Roseiflexaceae bacterium]HMP40570.1 glucose 1-dehydrogenase [Roseiflexaceae bacterium]